jgi:hypothetical protein
MEQCACAGLMRSAETHDAARAYLPLLDAAEPRARLRVQGRGRDDRATLPPLPALHGLGFLARRAARVGASTETYPACRECAIMLGPLTG